MKYVLAYKARTSDTAKGNLDASRSAQKLLTSWQPHAPEGISEWLQRVDGTGGFAVVQTDDAAALFKDMSTWSPWLEFEVIPVIDLADATAMTEAAIQAAAAALD
jgi:hypothetical protein